MWTLKDLVLLLSSFFFFLVLLSCLTRWKMYLKYRNLPPGPFCWPLLGHLPFLNKNNNHRNLKKLAEKFGGVFSLHVGCRYVVVIDDFEALKDSHQRDEFWGRPEGSFRMCPDVTQRGITEMSGEEWMDHRKFWLNGIRHMTRGQQDVRHVTMAQIQEVVGKLRSCTGRDVRADQMLELALNNVSFFLEFGKTFPQDHSIIKLLGQYDDSLLNYFGLNSFRIFYPWLGKLVALMPKFRRAERDLEKMDKEIRKEILEHVETLDANDSRDFVDLFLLRMQRKEMAESYSMTNLLGTAKMLLAASSETTRNSLVWFLLLMAKYPEVQEEIQQQIDSTLGREREPLLEDKTRLPLLDAALMENLRYNNLFHLNIPRWVLRDTSLHGYDIPKDTIVVHNMRSHFRNPKYWSNPDRFDPGRFLSSDRKRVIVPEHFIPFSYGKRNCVGEKVANSSLFLFSASLLQKFTIKPPDGGINMNIKVNFTNGQEHPVLQFHLRSES